MALLPNAEYGHFFLEVSRSLTTIGHLWTFTQQSLQTSMPPVGFESTVSGGEQPQTYALDRAVTATYIFGIIICGA